VTAAGIFLTHEVSPRIRRHFRRLRRESGHLVTWHFVHSVDTGPRPRAPFSYEDPAEVMARRYRETVANGGVYGGYLDTLFVPVLRALPADHLWLMEYDVDYSGSWEELFEEFADNEADLLATSVMTKAEQPDWPWWRTAGAPDWVREEQLTRSMDPLMRVSRQLLNTYAVAMADGQWQGIYEYTLATIAVVSGAQVEDLGNQGSFTPPQRRGRIYVGKSPAGTPDDMTFRFRPSRRRYFHEAPDRFQRPHMLYHPVKPGVADLKNPPLEGPSD